VLQEAARELKEFHMAWTDQRIPVTVGAVHLRTAVRLLEELIGAVDVDEILGTLFSAFCVGK
jgi:tRNA modification GTPase